MQFRGPFAVNCLLWASAGTGLTAQTLTSFQDFGSAAVNGGSPVTEQVAFQFTGISNPAFSLRYGTDFTKGAAACSGAPVLRCSVPVTFSPQMPGLRQDAVLARDGSGNVIATTLLRGVGLAPKVAAMPGIIKTIAGTGAWNYTGDNGPASSATLRQPQGVALDGSGNLYIADLINQVIRKVSSTGIITTVAGTGYAGFSGDNGPAIAATLNSPTAVALDGAGNLFIADFGNNRVRELSGSSGIITTVAGGGTGGSGADGLGDGGLSTAAILNGPSDLAVDPAGDIYIADSFDGLVREVNASSGVITVIAGGGNGGGSDGWGDGGEATSAVLANPTGIALDISGNLYIADNGHNVVREVNASTGVITVVAGNGASGYRGDHNPAVSAELKRPWTVRIDACGDLYIADYGNSAIRQVSGATGIITTFAGTGSGGYAGDGGFSNAAQLQNPTGLAVDAGGNIYIADYANNVIRRVAMTISTLSFPATAVGKTSVMQVAIANTGNQSLGLSGLSIAGNFVQTSSGGNDCSPSSSIASGGACSVAVAFAPTAAGSSTGSIAYTTNSLNSPGSSQTVVLNAMGTPGTAAQATLSPASLTFGNQTVGSASAPQTITFSNTGGAAVSISSIWLSGQNASDFGMSTTCGTSVAPGASCAVSITFSPTASGTRSAQISFNDSATNSPQVATFTGNALAQVSLTPSSLSFGQQNIGSASAPQTVTLSNGGASSLPIASASISGANAADFSMTSTCGSALAAGANCAFSVIFAPSAIGVRAASLSVSIGNSPQSTALSGFGAGQLSVNPPSLSFGAQTIGTSAAQTITLSNTSSAVLNVNSIWLAGTNSSDFRISSACPSSLTPGAACNISITFLPSAAGARTASLSVTNTGTASPRVVALSGTGAGFTIVPGNLQQISVGADGAVWGLNSGGQIYRWNAAQETWVPIPGGLASISVGNALSVWGLNASSAIYRYDPGAQTWVQVPGSLAQLAIGSDGDVWGINGAGQAYHYVGGGQVWQPVAGATLAQIAAGFDGAVWGIGSGGQLYRFNPELGSWEQIAGLASQVSVGADGAVWALNAGQVYRFNSLTQSFELISGQQLTCITTASANNVWGITTSNQTAHFDLSTQSWITFPGGLASIAAALNGSVWGLDANGAIYQASTASLSTPSFHQVPSPPLATIAAAPDGNVWGIDASGELYGYNIAAQTWKLMGSNVAQVSVGFDQNVWALGGNNGIYRFDIPSQTFLQVPGALTQIKGGRP